MPKGKPNKRYTPEFKIKVVETMHRKKLIKYVCLTFRASLPAILRKTDDKADKEHFQTNSNKCLKFNDRLFRIVSNSYIYFKLLYHYSFQFYVVKLDVFQKHFYE